ncbi:transglycosylase domain-containing protein [Streptomyces sp. 7-21]|uniref:transglycosylase domain-containing protein n=1 Tax=Streptomyces sp. 7-21 TaxID=2802283 RepID=UPI0027DD90E0|nr:transglycosylase domain-containing protein [Streptomyces sp. 7-21]
MGRRRRAAPAKRKRFIDYPRSGYHGLRRWVPSWKQVLGSAVTFLGLLIGLVGIAYWMVEIPSANALAVSQSNVYYWADGTRMVTSGDDGTNRVNVELSDIPEACQESVVAAENASFWDDPGIDPMGIGRAMLNMARGGSTQSGSTITQQYVKNMYLTQDQSISRKVHELLLSVKVGAQVSKDDILQGYFNTSYFGRGAYGIQAAAQAYYGVNAVELDDSQCAYLTTLLRGSALYDPYNTETGEEPDPDLLELAQDRWSWVLDRRVETGSLTEAERAQFDEFPMPQEPTPAMNLAGQIGYMTQMADQYLISNEILTEEELARGGYHIYTTFDKQSVDQMEAAVEQVRDEYIDPEERPEDRHVQFGGASVIPGDGAITAIYGGEDYTEHYLNNANNPQAQVGSTFKPFVLAAAMRDGIRDPEGPPEQDADERTPISLDSVYRSEDGLLIHNYDGSVWHGDEGETLHQANFEGGDHGDITLWEATQVSANSPFVQLGMDIGPATVKEAAMDAGLLEETLGPADDTVPSFPLGVSTPGPMRMASAYSTFAANGEQADPYSVYRVETSRGVYWEHEIETEQAFDSDIAANVTQALQGVMTEEGSGAAAADFPLPVAGKTGTTDDNRSAWFVGYTANLSTAIGMWRSADSEDELVGDEEMGFLSMYGTAGLERINGGSLPLEVWETYMREATEGDDPVEFPEAPDIGEVVYGGGASEPEAEPEQEDEEQQEDAESPDPTQTESEEESEEPEAPPSQTEEEPGSPPADECSPWDWGCDSDSGGESGGGDLEGPGDAEGSSDGGDQGGSDSEGDSDSSGGPGGWGDSGAIFGRGWRDG